MTLIENDAIPQILPTEPAIAPLISPQGATRLEQNPQYVHVKQLPSLCGAANLEMIFKRRGVDVDQQELAKALEIKIPKGISDQFSVELPISEDPKKAGVGLDVFVSEKMKHVSDTYNVQLKTQKYRMDEIGDFDQFLEQNLKQGNDILVNYVDVLGKQKGGLGHYALVSAKEGDKVNLCDPWQGNDPFYDVNIHDLAREINTTDAQGTKRGIIIFSGPLAQSS